jgi:hypothetical protein
LTLRFFHFVAGGKELEEPQWENFYVLHDGQLSYDTDVEEVANKLHEFLNKIT